MKNLLFLLAFLSLGLSSYAQPEQYRGGGHGDRTGRGDRGDRLSAIADSLDLSPEQRARVQTLTQQLRTDLKALREADAPDARTERKALMEKYADDLRAGLTPEQGARLTEWRERREDARQSHTERHDSLKTALRARHAELAPMYKELAQLKREKIGTVMAELRTEFDRELSERERADITRLREAMLEQRRLTKAQFKTGDKSGDEGRDKGAAREAMKQARETFRTEHATEIATVQQIAERHEATLAGVRAELKAREATWASEADAIRAKYMTPEEVDREQARHEHWKSRGEGKHSSGHRESHEQRGAVRFLLMKPGEADTDVAEDAEDLGETQLNVYPNPASAAANVAFDVRADGQVRVELIDASGRLIEVLLDERRVAGPVQLSVELPNDAGSTLLRITDAKGVRTQVVARTR